MRKCMLLISSFLLEHFQTWIKNMASFPSMAFESRIHSEFLFISIYELRHTYYGQRSHLDIDLIVSCWVVLSLTTVKWKYSSVEIIMWGSFGIFFILLLCISWQKYECYEVASWLNKKQQAKWTRLNWGYYRDLYRDHTHATVFQIYDGTILVPENAKYEPHDYDPVALYYFAYENPISEVLMFMMED